MNTVSKFSSLFRHVINNKSTLSQPGIISPCRSLKYNYGFENLKLSHLRNFKTVIMQRNFSSQALSSQMFNVTGYATSEEYKLESLKHFLKSHPSFNIVELPEDAMDVLHVRLNYKPAEPSKEFFLFREGSVVFWNCSDEERLESMKQLSGHQVTPYDPSIIEEQSETFRCSAAENKSGLVNGNIHLQKTADNSFDPLEMFTFSNAISHSVKLAIWESVLDKDVTSNKCLLEDLKRGRSIKISMNEVLKRCGGLYNLRHDINLGSSLLDTPDFYWDRSNLEKLYLKTCQFLNIPGRTKVINEKLHHSVEFMELIRDHLKDQHHTRLELMIIFLIMIEVFFGSCHFLKEYFPGKNKKKESIVDE